MEKVSREGKGWGAILNQVLKEGHAVMNKGLKASDEEHPEQRDQSVQRPWGRTGPGVRGRGGGGGQGGEGAGPGKGQGAGSGKGSWRTQALPGERRGPGGLLAEKGAGPDSCAHGLPLAVVGRKDCEG